MRLNPKEQADIDFRFKVATDIAIEVGKLLGQPPILPTMERIISGYFFPNCDRIKQELAERVSS